MTATIAEKKSAVPAKSPTAATEQAARTITREKIAQGKPVSLPEMEEAAMDALRNDKFLRGDNVFKFEEEFARFVGTDYAVSTSSGTNALQFIFISLGIKGKKVVTTPMSFIASANAVIHAEGTPVFADISEHDYCLGRRRSRETAARRCLWDAAGPHLRAARRLRRVPDSRGEVPRPHSRGRLSGPRREIRRQGVGSLGVAGAFSFYPSKNMTVLGDGGMVTTDDEKIAKDVSKLRDGGRSSWYEHDMLGYTSRLNSANAAIGRVQLRHLEEWNTKRRESSANLIAADSLRRSRSCSRPPRQGGSSPSFTSSSCAPRARDALKDYLGRKGIECGIHYPIPIHLQPIYRAMFGFREGDYPKSERLASECLSLPMHPFLTTEDARYVCENISEFYAKGRVTA